MPTNLHRYYGAGYLHFITTSCYRRSPVLGAAQNRDLFLEVMENVRRRYCFVVVGYVVMLEHVHLLFSGPERGEPRDVRWQRKAVRIGGTHSSKTATSGAATVVQRKYVWVSPDLNPLMVFDDLNLDDLNLDDLNLDDLDVGRSKGMSVMNPRCEESEDV